MRLVHVFSVFVTVCAGSSILPSIVSQPEGIVKRTLLSGDLKNAEVSEFLGRRGNDDNNAKKCGDEDTVYNEFNTSIQNLDVNQLELLEDIILVPYDSILNLYKPMKDVTYKQLNEILNEFARKSPVRFKTQLNAIDFLKRGGFFLKGEGSPFIRCNNKIKYHLNIVRFLSIFNLDNISGIDDFSEDYLNKELDYLADELNNHVISEKIRCAFLKFTKDFFEFAIYMLSLNEALTAEDNDDNDEKKVEKSKVRKLVKLMKDEDPKQCLFVYDLHRRLDKFANEKNLILLKKYYDNVSQLIVNKKKQIRNR
ncbi:hypothetical protein AYI69_g10964 [Smittium culicis]|uniref:Uncharacterized protein n=1 Tax=Smittium culicis TaxID=133412 RepID=A0A1R1X254_9FUNG|nr:hypothetical protein AYI69_g10964 [Smittium culicis]